MNINDESGPNQGLTNEIRIDTLYQNTGVSTAVPSSPFIKCGCANRVFSTYLRDHNATFNLF